MKAKTYHFTASIVLYAVDENDAYDELRQYLNDVKLSHAFDCEEIPEEVNYMCDQCYCDMSEEEETENGGLCNDCMDAYDGKENDYVAG